MAHGLFRPALIAFKLLLEMVAVRMFKKNAAGASPLLVTATLVTTLVVGDSGFKLVNEAYSDGDTIALINAFRGIVTIPGSGE